MNKKLFAIIIALLIIFALSGCQLAREDGAANKNMEKLIGVYVSYDYADLFDFEGYINDNLGFFGGEINIDGETEKYDGRLYASRKDEVRTSSEGEKYTDTEFVFEDIPGIGMFAPTVVDPYLDGMGYISSGGDGLSDTNLHIKSSDDEEGLELSGTLYISPGALSDSIYINPVYQGEDGRVYLVSGQGFGATGYDDEGAAYSQEIEEKSIINENGKSKSFSSVVKISVETMNPTVKVGILQMDRNSNVVKKTEYSPDNVPDELKPEPETEYIIVESTKETFNKGLRTERTLFSKSDETLWYFRKSDDKAFVKAYTTILWE